MQVLFVRVCSVCRQATARCAAPARLFFVPCPAAAPVLRAVPCPCVILAVVLLRLRCALIWSGYAAQLSEANEEMGRCLREMGGSGDSNDSQQSVP
jgi:hypothetical protein